MRGEFRAVWSQTWREIWTKLARSSAAPADLFCELYRELARRLETDPTVEELAEIVDDPAGARLALRAVGAEDISGGEQGLLHFLEAVHPIVDDMGGDTLSNRYFILVDNFVDRFSLRYDLRRPCILCPTLPGVFSSLIRELRVTTQGDPHLDRSRKEFEDAVRDLRTDHSEGRIKTCIQKQLNLLEAVAARAENVKSSSLGDMCAQLRTWPHPAVRVSLEKLYGFASDYPGIRHGSNEKGMLRGIDMRDLVAITVLLAGFTPYLSEQLNAEGVYIGS